ncbi:MAG: family 10 glycosylhydrolase [Melioribacteraceae bacterium]|nr:family 10 glycosylhydrolase [Melioribacteraceae bacterium]
MKLNLLLVGLLFTSVLLFSCNNTEIVNEGKKSAVRGVWLTNVDSDVLSSSENIKEAVSLVDELGMNTIFVVTWNKAMTMYPSKIMKNFTGVEIDPAYDGRDPLQELIDEAHNKNIKVIAWFEFGFSASYNANGGILLEKKPHWASKNYDGNLVTKNGFDWMNGFNPEVQDFILSIICEVVENYNVDGIQGDDRLPAMPSEAGYDDYTVDLYKNTHNGEEPPEDSKDSEWLNWRTDIMNSYMTKLYTTVKAINPDMIISMSPSIFPWSKEEYLQDWPTWIKNKQVEIICPQIYRYSVKEYSETLNETVKYAKGFDFDMMAPGILLKLGDYYAPEEYLTEVIKQNRLNGINGEVYFFFEGLKKNSKFFKSIYKDKINFPVIN